MNHLMLAKRIAAMSGFTDMMSMSMPGYADDRLARLYFGSLIQQAGDTGHKNQILARAGTLFKEDEKLWDELSVIFKVKPVRCGGTDHIKPSMSFCETCAMEPDENGLVSQPFGQECGACKFGFNMGSKGRSCLCLRSPCCTDLVKPWHWCECRSYRHNGPMEFGFISLHGVVS